MSAPTDGVIPQAWAHLVETHHFARIDRDLMRHGATQQLRDEATTRYARYVDAIMDDLTTLQDAHQLGRITLLLGKKERR